MKTMPIRWTLGAFLMLGIGALFAVPAQANSNKMPFSPGERLEYQLRWGNVPAGSAWLEVHPVQVIDGQEVYHFVLRAESNSFVDVFYKVRDRIDAYADMDMTRSVRYEKKQREGKHEKEELIEFNWDQSTAHYSNYGNKEQPIELMEGSFDPLSAFYYTRMAHLEIGGNLERAITDGKKNVIGRLKVIARETITTLQGKTYDTYRIEPEMNHVGGVFKESDGAKIEVWVTADERRIPVRIRSKVAVGHFIGELISANTAK